MTASRNVPGSPAGPSRACRHQLLDEERVATTPSLHIVDVRPVDERAIDGVDELGGRRPIERPNVDPLTPTAFDLGEHRPQGVTTVQLVGPERADQQEWADPSDPGQRREQGARRAVCPVQILDDDHQRTSLSKALEHTDDELTQPVARHGLLVATFITELGHQRREQTSGAAQNEIEGVAVHVVHQLADDLAERCQRPDLLAEIHAPPDAHAEPSLVGPPRELVHRTGLADSRLARHEHHGRPAFGGDIQRLQKPRHLGLPTDEHRARRPQPHGQHLRRLRSPPTR